MQMPSDELGHAVGLLGAMSVREEGGSWEMAGRESSARNAGLAV